jgi:hypothetical protein
MGHRDLLVTQNLSDGEHHSCRPHPRGSVRRARGFVLTGKPEVIRLGQKRWIGILDVTRRFRLLRT